MEQLKQACNEILDQLIELSKFMTNEQFTQPLAILLQNSIGKHFRHIIEFYRILLQGFHTGKVNYDSRQHDTELEQSREKCLLELQSMKSRFPEPGLKEPMELSGSYSMVSDEVFSITTNAERELVYNIEHAIHHMAIIRIALQHEFPEIQLSDQFGYAYSTFKHLRTK